MAAFHAFRFRNVTDRRDAVFLGYGFGAVAIIWWERSSGWRPRTASAVPMGLSLTYGDSIGDLLLSSTGGRLGSFLAVRLLGPRPGESS